LDQAAGCSSPDEVEVAPTTYQRPPQYDASRTRARAPVGVGREDSRHVTNGAGGSPPPPQPASRTMHPPIRAATAPRACLTRLRVGGMGQDGRRAGDRVVPRLRGRT